jgi:hypothetical protein
MNANRNFAVLALAALCPMVAAQTASYTNYGTACNGTGAPYGCIQNNGNGGLPDGLMSLGKDPQVAIQVDSPWPMTLSSFDIYSYSWTGKRTVAAYLFTATTGGRPNANPVRTGTITVDKQLGWYRATFSTPLKLQSKQRFFLSWDVPNGMAPFNYPMVMQGSPYPAWGRVGTQTWYNSWLLNNIGWAFRVNCASNGQIAPRLTLQSLPRIGSTFSVGLGGTPAFAPYILVSGLSKTVWGSFPLPLDMSPLGAKSCSLLCSFDFMSLSSTDSSGRSSISLPIPRNTQLLGLRWHQQAIVLDQKANRLGFTFSNGGSVLVGN